MPTSLNIEVAMVTYVMVTLHTNAVQGYTHLSAVHFDKDSVDPKCWSSTRPLLPGDLKVSQCAVSVCTPRAAAYVAVLAGAVRLLTSMHHYVRTYVVFMYVRTYVWSRYTRTHICTYSRSM